MGKSKLRKPQSVNLGPQYAGNRVRRDALDEDEDEHDPFNWDSSGDENEEAANADGVLEEGSEDEQDVMMANGADGSSAEDEIEGDDEDTDLTDEDDMDSDDHIATKRRQEPAFDRSEIQRLMADTKQVAAGLSERAKQDAERGRAVKQQRTTFDALLNSRIKLQKSLVATNSLLVADKSDGITEASVVAQSAEAAAIKLWNNLNELRTTLHNEKSENKRSHREFTREDSLDAFWEESKAHETAQKRQRTKYLDYWASQTRSTTALPQARGRLQQPVKEQQLSEVLAGQLVDMDRLVAKTLVPRSCAPVQAASAPKSITSTSRTKEDQTADGSLPIYDDADFYTTLLANLISQRSADTAVNFSNLSLQPWQAAREAKTKKVVDTKASKGRKLRYTVHDKLVSFMAPEDRGTWGEMRVDDLFSSLLGRRIELEGVERADDDDDETEKDAEMEGLRLFGGR